jgi:ketol-acid reductoisomerase
VIGKNFNEGKTNGVDNKTLIAVNEMLRFHPIEIVGAELRDAMTDMKQISIGAAEPAKEKAAMAV